MRHRTANCTSEGLHRLVTAPSAKPQRGLTNLLYRSRPDSFLGACADTFWTTASSLSLPVDLGGMVVAIVVILSEWRCMNNDEEAADGLYKRRTLREDVDGKMVRWYLVVDVDKGIDQLYFDRATKEREKLSGADQSRRD